jgi:tripartite-type tricarboxylate transporter receptor subunit TctC
MHTNRTAGNGVDGVRVSPMKLPRRQFLRLAAGAAALPTESRIARAQTYPTHPPQIIVGFPAGGLTDITARLMGQWLSERLGQPFVIENRPGAAGNIAADLVAHATPDGYTLLLAGTANDINATVYGQLNFNFIRDIAPVASIASAALVMEVNQSIPVETVPEFIAYAKANPGKLNMASAGTGTATHVAGEMFKMMTGVDLVHVPYRGNPLPDLIAGQVQVMFDTLPSSIEYIRAGKLRALAVTTSTRSLALPDIPTVAEFLPGFEVSVWQGLGAPRNTPKDMIDKLNREINAGLVDPKLNARVAELGLTVLSGSPADLQKLVSEDTEKWAKVVRFASIKAD